MPQVYRGIVACQRLLLHMSSSVPTTTTEEARQLSQLVEKIYLGATDFSAWQRVVLEITAWIGATRTFLFTPFHKPEQGGFMITHDFTPADIELWATQYISHDLWAQRAWAKGLVSTGNVARDQELVTEEEFLASRIYREFLEPRGSGRVMPGVILGPQDNGGVVVACSLHRPFSWPFELEDQYKLKWLLPHLGRSMSAMFQLRNAEFRIASHLSALDELARGVLLFDAIGQVIFCNRAARSLLARTAALTLAPARTARTQVVGATDGDGNILFPAILKAATLQAQSALDAELRSALNPSLLSEAEWSPAARVSATGFGPACIVHFSSLVDQQYGQQMGLETPKAIAFLSEVGAIESVNPQVLEGAYGLTEAEMRVAQLVLEGLRITTLAERLDLSVNTIKTHLRRILRKTNTQDQASLIRLLSSLAVKSY